MTTPGTAEYFNPKCIIARNLRRKPYARCSYCSIQISECLGQKCSTACFIIILCAVLMSVVQHPAVDKTLVLVLVGTVIWLGLVVNKKTDEMILDKHNLQVKTDELAKNAIETEKLYHQTVRANKNLQAIHEAAMRMSAASVSSLADLCPIIAKLACTFVDAPLSCVLLSDEATGALTLCGQAGPDTQQHALFETRGMEALNTRKPMQLSKADSPDDATHLWIPIELKDRVLGVLHVSDGGRHEAFSRDDELVLAAHASAAAIALQNAILYEQLLEKERMEKELKIAASLQDRLIPKTMPFIPGLQVSGTMHPAREVGGDYFDLISDPDGHLWSVCIGDVSGKGIPAGIVMMMARSTIHALLRARTSPDHILVELNNLIAPDIEEDSFMSLLLMEWDADTKTLRYASAGHESIIVYRAASKQCEVIPSGGVAIGLLPDLDEYTNIELLPLQSGDLVTLYTDGVTEARNPESEEFGLSRLVEAVQRHAEKEEPPSDLIQKIMVDIHAFVDDAEQYDDLTLVAFRVV